MLAKKKSFTEDAIGSLQELRQKLTQVEAVSFDFFDTLFFRPLCDPEDVFDIIGHRFGIQDFRAKRRNAQAEAFRRMALYGRREVTLRNIYDCFENAPTTIQDLMQAEYDLELSILGPNQELIELFCEAISLGKPVVVVSDMYLPSEFFIACFRQHGLPSVPFFISSDLNATKRDHGELFDIVIDQLHLPPDKILHIGDNPVADITRAREKGLQTFHYQEKYKPISTERHSPAISVAKALIRTHRVLLRAGSHQELGFRYGGPAMVGFLDWIAEQTKKDEIDRVLFLSRDGYLLNRLAKYMSESSFPKFNYFYGSRTAFYLAAMDETNFATFIPFLLSGADGLSPYELLERIGITPPSDRVMKDLGLADDIRFTPAIYDRVAEFLWAFRWEILKVCRQNRRALFFYLRELGISEGDRVAIVDVGWHGTTQEAFELAIRDLIDIDVFGYYFCLVNSNDCVKRQQSYRMSAMLSSSIVSAKVFSKIYANRVVVELFFSAPHHSVIGWRQTNHGILPVEDRGRGNSGNLTSLSAEIVEGTELFAKAYCQLRKQIMLPNSPIDVAWPLIEFATEEQWRHISPLAKVNNFDAWASSRNRDIALTDY